jgi:hypothetical protein
MSEKPTNWYTEMVEQEGPEWERRYGFRKEVLIVFGPLLVLGRLGFHCVSADPFIVRFESDKMFMQISHSWQDYQIEIYIGKLQDPISVHLEYTLRNIVRDYLNIPDYEEYGVYAPNEAEVQKRVRQIAEMVEKYAMDALRGDESFLRGVDEAASRVNAEYNRRMKERQWYTGFVRQEGPERERRFGFRKEVLSVFEPLLGQLGFHCAKADPFIVRFESEKMFMQLSHDPFDYAIEVAIGKLQDPTGDQKYTLRNIVRDYLNIPDYEEYGEYGEHAPSEAEVQKRVRQIAELVEKYAVDALRGDESFLRGVGEAASRENAEYNEGHRTLMGVEYFVQ